MIQVVIPVELSIALFMHSPPWPLGLLQQAQAAS